MKKCLLFDWGDTIMKDFPKETGKMYTWKIVEAMPNAEIALQELSQHANCYLATNAKDSNKNDIIKALKRVNLHFYFMDIFCYKEIGHLKPSEDYFNAILEKLKVSNKDVIMIGDSLNSDIIGAQNVGIKGILFAPDEKYSNYTGNRINDLRLLKEHFCNK